ncbi:phenylacetic acid degradation protein PaaY [Lacisediminimonas profundi]|uniref:phenylacetic acid degradation protein PaaY n=1 Tax=Lacisediminimonas profundi TaxID=2603856 RepID=UPI00124BC8A1|nr:phenylacetic acid degradation protein PaaY [Lacisediminimonas profundi]
MLKVYSINGITPVVDPTAFVHPSAILIGDVIVGPRCYIGPAASLRGDFGRLVLKEGVNVQDTCVMHGFPDSDTVVEVDGHIGHGAVLHGCHVGRNALVGMNAVVMDGAVIGADSIVAAMAFVKAGMEIPPRSLVVGTPARVLRQVTDEELAWKVEGTRQYQELAVRSLQTMQETAPLSAPEANRPRLVLGKVEPLYKVKGK